MLLDEDSTVVRFVDCSWVGTDPCDTEKKKRRMECGVAGYLSRPSEAESDADAKKKEKDARHAQSLVHNPKEKEK